MLTAEGNVAGGEPLSFAEVQRLHAETAPLDAKSGGRDSKASGGRDSKASSGGDSKTSSGGDSKASGGGDSKAPGGRDSKASSGGDSKASSGGDSKASSGRGAPPLTAPVMDQAEVDSLMRALSDADDESHRWTPSWAVSAGAGRNEDEGQTTEERLSNIKSLVTDIETSVATLDDTTVDTRARLEEVQREVEGGREDIRDVREDLGALKEHMRGIREDIGVLRKEFVALYRLLTAQATQGKASSENGAPKAPAGSTASGGSQTGRAPQLSGNPMPASDADRVEAKRGPLPEPPRRGPAAQTVGRSVAKVCPVMAAFMVEPKVAPEEIG
jgi:hypothetical protein